MGSINPIIGFVHFDFPFMNSADLADFMCIIGDWFSMITLVFYRFLKNGMFIIIILIRRCRKILFCIGRCFQRMTARKIYGTSVSTYI